MVERPNAPQRIDTLEAQPDVPRAFASMAQTLSHKTGKTLLSGTEATQHHQSLDDIIDAKSVTSYAVTVKDIHGKGVDLPPPPKAANGEKDFECPYCYVICPARYGRGRSWRTHLLKDVEPYVCTYADCESPDQLFSKRREWIEHEASHRKAWRCPEHTTAVYRTRAALEDHLRSNHLDSFPESQLTTIADVGETTTMDIRQKCPICHVSVDDLGSSDFHNHIANHLERIAVFSLPSAVENDSDGASSIASRGWSGTSQDLSDLSLPSEVPEEVEEQEKRDYGKLNSRLYFKLLKSFRLISTQEVLSDNTLATDLAETLGSSRALLSAESLQQLPDMTQNRLEMTATQVETQNDLNEAPTYNKQISNMRDDEQTNELPTEIENHLEQREAFRSYLLSLPGAESVRFYRRYGAWTGQAVFTDETAATQAIISFGTERFPLVKIHQSSSSSNKLKFSAPNIDEQTTKAPYRQPTHTAEDDDDIDSDSSISIDYDKGGGTGFKPPILTASDIPNLCSLYRSRRLLQRDQSFAPNFRYNQWISLCYYDMTRLQVDAIVNSANSTLKVTRTPGTLNYSIFKAGGNDLNKEARSKGKMKPGQVELTRGHDLPSKW